MSRRKTIWINLIALGVVLTAALLIGAMMYGSFGASLYAKTLSAGSPRDRINAASALQELGPKATAAVPALLDVLGNPNDPSAGACARALREIDAQAAYEYSGALAARIERGEIALTPEVVDVFQGLGPVAWRAIPLLRGAVRTRTQHIRSLIPALIDMGDYSDEVLAAIVEDSRDPVYSTRKWDAMLAFDRLGARAAVLKPELERLAADPTPAVMSQAKLVLSQLARPSKYETSGLRGFPAQDVRYQEYALDKLSKQGADATDAVSDIVSELRLRSTLIRFTAAWTLAHIGPAASRALPDLHTALSDATSLVRDAASEAIRAVESRP